LLLNASCQPGKSDRLGIYGFEITYILTRTTEHT